MEFQVLGIHGNWLDIVLAAVLVIAFVRSIWTGFSRSVAGVAGVLAGFFVAIRGFPSLSYRLVPMIGDEFIRNIVAFLLLFLAVYLIFVIAGILVYGFFKALKLGWFDRTLGAMLGALKGILIAGVIMFVLTMVLPANSPTIQKSYLYPRLKYVIQGLTVLVPEQVKGRFMWKWRQFFGQEQRREGR